MRVFCEGSEIEVGEITVSAGLFYLARTFEIKNIEEFPSIKKGDSIRVLNSQGKLLILAVVEIVKGNSEKEWSFSGRNKGRILIDSWAKKSLEINKVGDLADFFKIVLADYDIKVKGSFKLPKKINQTIFAGENLGDIIDEKTAKYGVILSNDAEGNLEIYEKPTTAEEKAFASGSNIISSSFEDDGTLMYDQYVVISQGELKIDEDPELYIEGSVGEGKRAKVRIVKGLTGDDCKKIAEKDKKKGEVASFTYGIIIEEDEEVELNKLYRIEDNIVHIKEKLRAVEIMHTMRMGDSHIEVNFVRP